MGFEPMTSEIPMQHSYQRSYQVNCLSWVHNCNDFYLLKMLFRSSNIWISYIHFILSCWFQVMLNLLIWVTLLLKLKEELSLVMVSKIPEVWTLGAVLMQYLFKRFRTTKSNWKVSKEKWWQLKDTFVSLCKCFSIDRKNVIQL